MSVTQIKYGFNLLWQMARVHLDVFNDSKLLQRLLAFWVDYIWGIKCDSRQDLPKLLETKEMCLEYLLLLYTINPAPQQSKIEQKKKRNSLNQLLKKANIQSKTLRCQLRLSYTIHFDACQADNSRQNVQSRECRSLFMEVQLLVTQKKELIITISFLANLLVGSFNMSK